MAGLETPAKRRRVRTTQNQYELYINMLETNKYFRENKVTPDHPNELTKCWEDLVNSLNSSGGPQKSLNEWKRVFVDWKSQVRKRARIIKNSYTETGNKGAPERELSEIEKKLLYLTGELLWIKKKIKSSKNFQTLQRKKN
ncbi:uncharacterized protein [Onthophagus taurus]|uniref:uncharacterized protein isoform X2 n=1 Tax=Onthophagus taurus TaxID=166361 RepID=UPI0039BDF1BE